MTDYFHKLSRNDVFRQVAAALAGPPPAAPIALGGLAPGAAPLFAAALAREVDAPFLIVTPTPERADAFAQDARAYGGVDVAVLESPGVLPLKPVSPPLDVSAGRIRALLGLAAGARPWLVASAAALGRRLPPPGALREAMRRLRPGEAVDLAELEAHLVLIGYERVGMVEGPAQFARRGALLDLFPPGAELAYRAEFFGDTLESIRRFDVWTQRRADAAPEVDILPTREVVLESERIVRALAAIRERYGDDAAADAYEALDLHRYFDGIENLLPFFYDETAGPEAYFPRPPIVLALEAGGSSAAMEAARDLGATHPFPYPKAAELLFTWDELTARLMRAGARVIAASLAAEPRGVNFRSRGVDHLAGRLDAFADEARAFRSKGRTVVTVERPEQTARFDETVADHARDLPYILEVRPAYDGFIWEDAGLAVIPAWRILKRRPPVGRRRLPRYLPGDEAVRISSAFDLEPGDLIIHADHGVGKFEGLVAIAVEEHEEEFLHLTYAGGDRLYVPVYNLKLVHKYVGGDPATKGLDRLGGVEWRRARRRAQKSAEKLAKQLLEIYAARSARPGFAFGGDAEVEQELAETFPFVETPDQLQAIEDVLADMGQARPMDRLVCGDVGFGKTEVAVRAALRAVVEGKQAAVLVPTTILADQHYQTFKSRLAPFPVRVEMLSRFRTAAEQKAVAADLTAGKVDVVIGTHRLLSKDVVFADLGLLIVDEEQRFGVAQKEKIKAFRKLVDVLTLTATPIPRTLHMSLAGLRDLSLIGTAPLERFPIQTTVAPFDEELIVDAVTRERGRGGQVFFVHNRVRTIDAVAAYLGDLLPETKIGVAHGQLAERELERIMHDFGRGCFDMLVSSAIIEAGLDFPNVNTIIINRADAFGLSQLHQLRGRVGRSHARAYAYLLTPPSHALTDVARQRLQALREATELGSGFQLAMRDLEIRGAGNILGPEQSGAVAAVGLDLYTQMLAGAVATLKGEEPGWEDDVPVRLDRDAFLPADYVPGERQRLSLYRRISEAPDDQTVDRLAEELRDRFGPLPEAAARLLLVRKIRYFGRRAGIAGVRIAGPRLTVEFLEGRFERAAALGVPPEVRDVEVLPRLKKKTVVFTIAPPAAPEEVALALARKFASA